MSSPIVAVFSGRRSTQWSSIVYDTYPTTLPACSRQSTQKLLGERKPGINFSRVAMSHQRPFRSMRRAAPPGSGRRPAGPRAAPLPRRPSRRCLSPPEGTRPRHVELELHGQRPPVSETPVDRPLGGDQDAGRLHPCRRVVEIGGDHAGEEPLTPMGRVDVTEVNAAVGTDLTSRERRAEWERTQRGDHRRAVERRPAPVEFCVATRGTRDRPRPATGA